MSVTLPPKVGLEVEDFRRLGVRPHECRLTVIRRAAARSARALAEKQLTSPTDQVGLQLSRVATSAYRLLDPRQRNDVHQRAYVGRILPNALSWAGQTGFHSDSKRTTPETLFGSDSVDSDSASDAALIETLDLNLHESGRLVTWNANLNDDDLLNATSLTRRIRRTRRRLRHPWIMLVLAGLTIGTLLGLATLRSRYKQEAPTSVQPEPVPELLHTTVPKLEYISPAPVLSESDSPQPELAPLLEIAGGMSDVPSESEVGLPEVGGATVEVDPVAPLESSSNDPDPVSEQPLDEPGSVSSGDGVFLSDPFASWGLDDSPPAKQDAQLPTVAVPDAELVEPPAVNHPMTALDPSSRGDLSEPAVPRRSVPEPASVRAARAQLVSLVPELADTVVPQAVESRIASIETLEKDLTIGTSDSWTARMMIGELAWLVEDAPQVSRRLKPLTETYQVQLHQLLAETFVAACDLARLPDTREHLLSNGLVLADQLLLAESFQDCRRVVDAAGESAAFLDNHSALAHLKQFSQAADQMSRSSDTSKRLIDDAGEISSDAGDVGIAGRYYCLMLRRWETGLPWLVDASDLRIARIARQELELDDEASADDLITVSQRWLTVAARSSGRASNSMRMHAIDLMRKAQLETSGLKKLEIERTIDEVLEVLPPYLHEATSKLDNTPAPMDTGEPKPAVSSDYKYGLGGRIKIEGKDIGVQLNYELDVAFTQSVLDTIATRTKRDLSKMAIQLVGEFDLDDSTTIGVAIAAAEQGVVQRVQVDDTSLEFDPLDDVTEVALEAGTHHVAWTIEADRFSRAFLRLHDTATGRRLTVVQPAAAGPGTTLTVAMVRGAK